MPGAVDLLSGWVTAEAVEPTQLCTWSVIHSTFTERLARLDQSGYARTWRSLVKITGPLLMTAVNPGWFPHADAVF